MGHPVGWGQGVYLVRQVPFSPTHVPPHFPTGIGEGRRIRSPNGLLFCDLSAAHMMSPSPGQVHERSGDKTLWGQAAPRDSQKCRAQDAVEPGILCQCKTLPGVTPPGQDAMSVRGDKGMPWVLERRKVRLSFFIRGANVGF